MAGTAASCCSWFGTALLPFLGYMIAVYLNSPEKLPHLSLFKSSSSSFAHLSEGSSRAENTHDLAHVDPTIAPFPVMPASVADWQFHARRKQVLHDPFPAARETETYAVLRQAKVLYGGGRVDKAEKLFKRALQFSPRSPDALAAYGEFLHREKDPLEAEKLLAKALLVRPDHMDAQRVLSMNAALVQDMDRGLFVAIDKKRNALLKVPRDDSAFIRALRENYVRHIYHSNAIEGNTLTLSMVRSILETGLAVGGKSVQEHNDILGLDLALNFVHQTTLKQRRIGVEDILALHHRLMGHSQPLDAGKFRDTQVFVSSHIPPPPKHLHRLMEKYGQWLVSAEAAALHPIARAAMDHFKLVHIHPFVDGNGRLSRLVMNIRLMQGGYPPVIIPVQERYTYYEKLSQADEGDVRPFIRYIANLTDRTIEEYLQFTQKQINEAGVPTLSTAQNETVSEGSSETAQNETVSEGSSESSNGDDDTVLASVEAP